MQFDGARLVAHHISAELGRQGKLHIQGTLPLQQPPPPPAPPPTPTRRSRDEARGSRDDARGAQVDSSLAAAGPRDVPTLAGDAAAAAGEGAWSGVGAGEREGEPGVSVRIDGLELRVRNGYTGAVDAALHARGSMAAPRLGGSLRFSKGTLFLSPPSAGPSAAPGAAAVNGNGSGSIPVAAGTENARKGGGGGGGSVGPGSDQQELVRQVFSLLKAGRKRAMLSSLQVRRGEAGGRRGKIMRHHYRATCFVASFCASI